MDTDSSHVRLSAIGIVALSLFLVMFVRLWFLQGIDRQRFEVASASNRLRVIHEEGPRGRILDRNGVVIVDNRTSITVALDREPLRKMTPEERTARFQYLADTLTNLNVPIKQNQIQARYDDKRYSPQQSVPLADDVTEEVEIYLSERATEFPGVVVESRSVRTYPYGPLASHLVGYVGEINDKELVERGGETATPSSTLPTTTTTQKPADGAPDKDYQLGDSIGKSGVERTAEATLRAVPGERTIEVNARGDMVDIVSRTKPKAGDDVWLTIDINVQSYAELLLQAKIEALRGQTDKDGKPLAAPQGSVVIQDPQNGQVIAMASYPDYDPSILVNGMSTELWKRLTDASAGLPLNNWAMQGTYAPGSTFKLFTATAGAQSGFIGPGHETYMDNGVYKLKSCKGEKCEFRNAGGEAHGRVDLARALTVSSDVYFYWLGESFWVNRGQYGETPIQDAAAQYGLGQKTGIDLPGENPGRLPTPAGRKAAFEANPEAFINGNWYTGDNIITATGQGDVLATPLQLADAYGTFANGGTRFKPEVISKVTRATDPTLPPGQPGNFTVVHEVGSQVAGRVEMPPEAAQKIWEGLWGVTQNSYGTASASWHANPTAWPMAGKTGTAQVNGKADTSLFVGFGPAIAGTPANYVISVVIPEAGFGGDVAAPLAFRIMQPVSQGAVPPACPIADHAACDAALQQSIEASAHDVGSGGPG